MAQLPIPYGTVANDGTGIPDRTAFQRIQDNFTDLYAIQSRTVNAGDVRFAAGATTEARIQMAIDQAVIELAARVYVPAFMLPYDASLVTFNNAVQMVREGGEWTPYDLQAYGAACDGVAGVGTADDAAWAAVIAVAHANNGTIAHSGFRESLITAPIVFPNNSMFSLVGVQGNATIKAKTGTAPFGPMFQINGTSFGSRYGILRDLLIDGNNVATQGLDVGLCVERSFQNISVRNCTQWGLRVRSAQNCLFTNVNVEENGTTGALDTNLLLDLGAGNNAFVRCEFGVTAGATSKGQYNVVIRQSGASPSGAFSTPQSNTFYACVIERSSTTHLGAILQRAGRNNTFIRCDIETSGARRAVTVNSADGSSSCLRLNDCAFTGTLASSIAVSAVGTELPAVVFDSSFLENFLQGFEVANTTNVEFLGVPITGAVTTLVVPTGTDTAPGLLTQRLLKINGTPSNANGVPPGVGNLAAMLFDGTNDKFWIYNGAWKGIKLFTDDNVDFLSYKVSGTKVVGAQGAAVADATDAASAITQLNALLARCRAHGLIAP